MKANRRSHFSVALVAETRADLEAKLAKIPEAIVQFYGGLLLAGTPQELVAHYRELVAAGMQYFVVVLHGADMETLRLLGERVIPAFRDVYFISSGTL